MNEQDLTAAYRALSASHDPQLRHAAQPFHGQCPVCDAGIDAWTHDIYGDTPPIVRMRGYDLVRWRCQCGTTFTKVHPTEGGDDADVTSTIASCKVVDLGAYRRMRGADSPGRARRGVGVATVADGGAVGRVIRPWQWQ